jgi:plastocyanin
LEKKMKKRINMISVIFGMIIISSMIVINGCNKSSYSTAPPSGGSGSPGANEVWMQGIAFNPASKTISVGTTITWTNKDSFAHTVTSGVPNAQDGLFNSGNLNNGATFSYKFNTVGTYKYYCTIHGSMMTATMIVQ